ARPDGLQVLVELFRDVLCHRPVMRRSAQGYGESMTGTLPGDIDGPLDQQLGISEGILRPREGGTLWRGKPKAVIAMREREHVEPRTRVGGANPLGAAASGNARVVLAIEQERRHLHAPPMLERIVGGIGARERPERIGLLRRLERPWLGPHVFPRAA